MDRVPSIALLAGLSAALAACGASTGSPIASASRGLESVNQPVVQRTDYVFDVAAGPSGLAAAERQRLDGWFRSLGLGYGDRVWVDDSYDSRAARDAVARVAADYGILLSDGAPITPGAVAPGQLRVIVSRSTAHVPNCPSLERAGPSPTSPNYGCAVNSNLAAMIADPSDLVLGQEGVGTADVNTTAKAIRVYRDKVPSGNGGLQSVSSKGGN